MAAAVFKCIQDFSCLSRMANATLRSQLLLLLQVTLGRRDRLYILTYQWMAGAEVRNVQEKLGHLLLDRTRPCGERPKSWPRTVVRGLCRGDYYRGKEERGHAPGHSLSWESVEGGRTPA